MREHKHSSKRLLRYGSRSALSLSGGQQQMTQAAALSLIALLVAPAIVGAHSSRRLVQNRSRGVRKTAEWCSQQVTGCSACTERVGTPAAGAQFPGMPNHAPGPISIVTCTSCSAPYVFDRNHGNCACSRQAGSAFANGTLIKVELFQPAKDPGSTLSDVFPPGSPGYGSASSSSSSNIKAESGSSSSSSGNAAPAAGTTSATFQSLESSSSSSSTSSGGAAHPPSLEQLQASLRRRFLGYLQAHGYQVQSRGGSYLIARGSKNTLFSAAAGPGGEPQVLSETPQQLICVPCKPGSASPGGPIGGSFCMPCGKGEQPDAAGFCSKS